MQKTLAAATLAAVLGMSGGAYAADLSAGGSMKDAPAYVPDTGSWTGFYLGAGVGGAMTNDDFKGSLTKNNNDPSLKSTGWAVKAPSEPLGLATTANSAVSSAVSSLTTTSATSWRLRSQCRWHDL